MATALAELFVDIKANTTKLDAGLIASRAKVAGLSAQFGQTRNAAGQFTTGAGAGAAAMAGRWVDSTGRMREANGRFVGSAQAAAKSVGGIRGAFSIAFSGVGSILSGAFSGVRGTISGIGSAISGIGSTFSSIIGKLKFPALIGGAAGAGAVGFAVKEAIDLERSFGQIRKVTNLTGTDLLQFKDQIKDMATSLPGISLDSLLGIAEMGGRMGIAGPQLVKFTRDMAYLSIAMSDIPAEEAATGVARILKNFGLGFDKALGFASALNKLDDSSTATGRELIDMAQRISPVAATLGVLPEEVLALAAAMRDAGIGVEIGSTAISGIFGRMAKDVTGFAAIAGVSTEDFAAMLRGSPMDALNALVANVGRMDVLDAFSGLGDIGIDGRGATQVLLALSHVQGSLANFTAEAGAEMKSEASITKEVSIVAEQTWASIQLLTNGLRIMAAEMGEFALPLVKALGTSFGVLADQARTFVAGNAEGIAGFFAPLVTGAKNVGILFTEWPTFMKLAGIEAELIGIQIVTVFGRVGGFLTDLFKQVGANMKANLINAFNSAFDALLDRSAGLANFLGPAGLAALGPFGKVLDTMAIASEALKSTPLEVPEVKPGNIGGLFAGLDARTLNPELADRKAKVEGEIAAARRRQDADRESKRAALDFDPSKSVLSQRFGLDAATRARLLARSQTGLPSLGKAAAPSIARRKQQIRDDAAIAKRRANASKAREARAARRKPANAGAKSPTIDVLQGIQNGIDSMVGINTDVKELLKKRVIAEFG